MSEGKITVEIEGIKIEMTTSLLEVMNDIERVKHLVNRALGDCEYHRHGITSADCTCREVS